MRYVYLLQLNNEIGYSVGICTLAYYKIRTVVGVIRGMQLCTLNDQHNHHQQQQHNKPTSSTTTTTNNNNIIFNNRNNNNNNNNNNDNNNNTFIIITCKNSKANFKYVFRSY